MEYLRVALIFALSTGTRIVSGLLVIKVIALNVGAQGLGQLGQFMSVMGMITAIAGGGISTGLVKYIAQYRSQDDILSQYLTSGSLITVFSSGILGVLLCIFAEHISLVLIGTAIYKEVFYAVALMQFVLGCNNYAIALINGHQDVRGYAFVSVVGTIVGTGILYFSTMRYGLIGAMYGLVFMPAVITLFSVPYVVRFRLLSLSNAAPKFNREKVLELLRYSGMMVVTICTLPVAQIIIREIIGDKSGWDYVGYWQGVTKISDAYLQFVTVVLASYYHPKLSAIATSFELRQEVFKALRIAALVMTLMACAIFLLKDHIITLLFTQEFMPMRDFFLFQLLGDCLKACSWVIVYVGIAKGETKLCILAEIFQAICLVALSYVCITLKGPLGATYAYSLNYLIYFLVLLYALNRYLKFHPKFIAQKGVA